MKAAVVVNIKAGEDYDVYIGRPSKWGNPYTLGRERRAVCVGSGVRRCLAEWERLEMPVAYVAEVRE